MTTKNVPRHGHESPGWQNHSWLRAADLDFTLAVTDDSDQIWSLVWGNQSVFFRKEQVSTFKTSFARTRLKVEELSPRDKSQLLFACLFGPCFYTDNILQGPPRRPLEDGHSGPRGLTGVVKRPVHFCLFPPSVSGSVGAEGRPESSGCRVKGSEARPPERGPSPWGRGPGLLRSGNCCAGSRGLRC